MVGDKNFFNLLLDEGKFTLLAALGNTLNTLQALTIGTHHLVGRQHFFAALRRLWTIGVAVWVMDQD
jgi:hypothetical protein